MSRIAAALIAGAAAFTVAVLNVECCWQLLAARLNLRRAARCRHVLLCLALPLLSRILTPAVPCPPRPPAGVIVYAGDSYSSISSFALAAARSRNPQRQACDGWKEVRLNAQRLDTFRAKFIQAGLLNGSIVAAS